MGKKSSTKKNAKAMLGIEKMVDELNQLFALRYGVKTEDFTASLVGSKGKNSFYLASQIKDVLNLCPINQGYFVNTEPRAIANQIHSDAEWISRMINWQLDKNAYQFSPEVIEQLTCLDAQQAMRKLGIMPANVDRLPHANTLCHLEQPIVIPVSKQTHENYPTMLCQQSADGGYEFVFDEVSFSLSNTVIMEKTEHPNLVIELINSKTRGRYFCSVNLNPDHSIFVNILKNYEIVSKQNGLLLHWEQAQDGGIDWAISQPFSEMGGIDNIEDLMESLTKSTSIRQLLENNINTTLDMIVVTLPLILFIKNQSITKRLMPVVAKPLLNRNIKKNPRSDLGFSPSIKRYVVGEELTNVVKQMKEEVEEVNTAERKKRKPARAFIRCGHYRNTQISERHEAWEGEKTGEKGRRQYHLVWINPSIVNGKK